MKVRETLLAIMSEEAYKPMSFKQLAKVFGIHNKQQKEFGKVLDEMVKDGQIIKNDDHLFEIATQEGLISGKLQGHPRGFGFVIPDSEDHIDIFIPGKYLNGAVNGDKVIARVIKKGQDGKKCEGEIVTVTERGNKEIIGIYQDSRSFGFVVPEEKRIARDIFIPKSQRKNAKEGDIVIVEVTDWRDESRNPEGKIIEVLGQKGDKGIDILTIIRKYQLPEEFSKNVERFVDKFDDEVDPRDFANRRDLRDLRMVTIDGSDAKDLDDAVSIERLSNGNYRLGVHIADVSHYVTENSVLDKEAISRATSVYLIDRVIPMLPKKLSNGLCSLNPKVDRLALSCFMDIDKTGKVVSHEVCESVINTDERMTYSDVTKMLRDEDAELIERYSNVYQDFKEMEKLCGILNKKRLTRGAIDFDFEECKIILNELGKPIEIKPYERAVANRIIEEFMLVCNETIAEHMFWLKLPFVYRVHEDPDAEKLQKFSEFIYNLGYTLKKTAEVHPKNLQDIVNEVKGKNEEKVVSTLLLRSMKQARYSPECSGHFGLSAKYYCHFTSPIRRYPDLMIHRIIKKYLRGEMSDGVVNKFNGVVAYAATQSSERERVAQEAEREVDDLKKAEYMSERIGEIHTGTISSVTNFGMFIELPNTVEGLVHITDLDDDYYAFDDRMMALVGERTKKIHRLGEQVQIIVDRVNIDAHEIYFKLYEAEEEDEA